MIKKGLFICLSLAAVAGTACTQDQNAASADKKRAYNHGNYVQTGSHLPKPYEESAPAGNLSSEQERTAFQRFQNNSATAGMPRQ